MKEGKKVLKNEENEQRKIFARNLGKYIALSGKTQKEIADDIGVLPQTLNTWCKGVALPRMGKVQRLAVYFHVSKSDLIDAKSPAPSLLTLSPLEEQLIIGFRRADSVMQSAVLRILAVDTDGDVKTS